jgi:hypothetical protein
MPTSAKRIKPETEVKEKFLTFYKSIFLRRHVNGIQQTIDICRPDVREKKSDKRVPKREQIFQ